jgi:TP901 family phage tail tape measure protein
MSERIEQEFIINASQALSELVKLDKSLQGFEARLNSVARTMGNINSIGGNGFAAFKAGAQNASTAVTGLNNALGGTNAAGSKAVVTFATLSRVIQTQLTVSALGLFRESIRDSITDAKELQKQFALIATIAQRVDGAGPSPVSTEAISAGARGISDSLNLDQLKVAQGLYNAVSNQVGNFSESLIFSAEAGKLAKATGDDLASTVDSLSAVLKSYNLSADQTSRVSDILFATIDKGRVTSQDLGSTLGRVLPAASELGVRFEEVAASIAAVSVKGLSTDETLTQIRATLTGLIKPSDAMKLAFEGLGISSAKAGIQQFELVGLLDKLRKSYGQNEQALGKLFPNVRNIGAVFALTGNNLDDYNKTLEAVTNSTGKANEAFKTATNTGAERLSAALNRSKNALASVASQFIDTTASVLDSTGVLDTSGQSVEFVTSTLLKGGLALGAYTAAASIATGALSGFWASAAVAATRVAALNTVILANPLTAYVAGLVAVTLAVDHVQQSFADARQKGFDELNKVKLDAVNAEVKKLSDSGVAALKTFDDSVRSGRTSIEGAISLVGSSIRSLAQDDAVYISTVETSLNNFFGARDRLLSGLKSAVSESAALVDNAKSNIQSLKDEQRDLKFDQSTRGLNDSGKAQANLTRAGALAREAQRAFDQSAASGDTEGLNRSKALFDQAKSAAKLAASLGATSRSEEVISGILRKRITNEEQLVSLQTKRNAEAQKAVSITQALNDAQKVEGKTILDNASTFDANGQPLREDALAQRQAALEEALGRLQASAPGELDISSILNVSSLRSVTEGQLEGLKADIDLQIKDGGSALIAQAQAIFDQFSQQDFVASRRGSGDGALRPEDLDARIESEREFIKTSTAADQTLVKSLGERQAAIELAVKSLSDIQNAIGTGSALENTGLTTLFDKIGFSDNAGLTKALEEAVPQLREILGEAVSNPDVKVEVLRAKFKEVTNTLAEAAADANNVFQEESVGFANYAAQLQIILDKTPVIAAAKEEASFTPEANTGPIQTEIEYYNRLTEAARRAAAAKAQAGGGGGFESFQSNSFGGVIQSFNSGGVARGVDTVAARLRPGESVLNPRATNRFFGAINALNAGQMPGARGQSSVTNVGDIHVNVGSSQSSGVNAREIANQLRRELQRGTSRL